MSTNTSGTVQAGPSCTPGERYQVDQKHYDQLLKQLKYVYMKPPDPLPDWELALKVLFYIPPFTIAIVGNVIVLLIVILNKRMRTTTNILIMNLSIADIAVALFCMWLHLGKEITKEWLFGSFFCRFNYFIQVVAVTSSVLTMTVISVERFIAIVFPLRSKMSLKMALVAISCSWMISMATATPYLFVMEEEILEFQNRKQIKCQEKWPEYYTSTCSFQKPERKLYYTVAVIVMYFLPVIIMVVTYTMIVVKLVFKKAPGGRSSEVQEKKRKRVIAMLISILVSFVICWTPQQFLLLWDAYRSKTTTPNGDRDILIVKYVALYMAYSNSAINPIMYAGFNENFRRGFVDVFRCALWRQRNRVHSDLMNSNMNPDGTGVTVADPRAKGSGRSGAKSQLAVNKMNVAATSSSRKQ